ncbi:leukocyte surface antigen CD47 isoform X3 [Cuculus canorus]|uniref:leukocyte surface antigen CD47 isoform X3 n=1 Tax=Cuculus canorus TaxID=55661 RepID=UPI0023AAEE1B|nr:leukocyte surface antigen CD47 isoform X3 [Cuculus canorus]
MWLLFACVLISALRHGSAQLELTTRSPVESTSCNRTVTLPCYVVDLKLTSAKGMFVTWQKHDKLIFSYDGATQEFFRDPVVPSANLASLVDLPKGVASLTFKNGEGVDGNYSCKVTVSNSEGKITVELRSITGPWFVLMERAFIIALLLFVAGLCLAQFIFVAIKYGLGPQKKICFIGTGFIFTVAAVVGIVFFVQDGYNTQSQAGFGLLVVPVVVAVPLQYLMFGIVFDSLPKATFVLIGLQILGYIIAVVGFALSVSACPPLHASVVIAGLAVMAIATLLSLAYVLIMGSRMKDHPRPGKAVEEPLNDAKGVMLE